MPTFESIGLYLDGPAAPGGCRVRYRAAGAAEWREGYPLVYDQRERQYRGSLVGLAPNTSYEIRLEADRGYEVAAKTRAEELPIGKTTHLPGGTTDTTLHVREGGTEQGWHLIAPAPGTKAVSDVFNLADHNVVIEADYVILRGLELRNAGTHEVMIREGVQHVVVEDCHITGWGRHRRRARLGRRRRQRQRHLRGERRRSSRDPAQPHRRPNAAAPTTGRADIRRDPRP